MEQRAPGDMMTRVNRTLRKRGAEGFYCTVAFAVFDFPKRRMVLANSGLPYPVRVSGDTITQVECPGVPLGLFPGSTYDESTFDLVPGDVYIFCSDGVYDANNAQGLDYGVDRLLQVVADTRDKSAREIVDAIFTSVAAFRGDTPPNDDTTAVAVRITNEGLKAEGSGRFPAAARSGS